MNIMLAFVLLVLLVIYIEKKDSSVKAERADRKAANDDLDWIDELEILDAATDDFI